MPHPDALALREQVAFFQAIKARLDKISDTIQGGPTDAEYRMALKQIVDKAIAPVGVVDVFAAAGLEKPNLSILSDEFLAEVRGMERKNLAVEALQKLLKDEVRVRFGRNIVKTDEFSTMLEAALTSYRNGTIEAAQVIEELIAIANKLRAEENRPETQGLSEDEALFYDALVADNMIQPISGLRYVTAYLSKDMIDSTAEPSLYEQLSNHAMEISTLKEADLCGSSSIDERIFVTTIHKAKGLEFDNVIIFDAVDGRMPNFYSRNNPRLLAEDARKFYVALSRARSRLYISQCIRRYDYRNMPHDVFTTPFMRHIAKYFQSNISSTGQ
jgi:type I site-specific restriction-modification system R (restriction) subunit